MKYSATLDKNMDIPGSFRDPSGFLFRRDGFLYRQVNISYKENYDHLMNSGLYDALVDGGLLIPHQEVNIEPAQAEKAYKIIRPEPVEFISYPYEWCFSQLKDAALATLRIQKKSMDFGMYLKDCTAYNVQFRKRKPVFIDTLSFQKYREGQPWEAYRQFCQHFLAPLALMSYKDIRLSQLSRIYMDGIPLDMASSLLPLRTRFMFSTLSHIHVHARSQKQFGGAKVDTKRLKVSRLGFLGLADSLESTIRKLKWAPRGRWAGYYRETNYSPEAFEHKKQILAEFLNKLNPSSVWDLGSNTGVFSRIAVDKGIPTISFDSDPAAVELNYLECVKRGETSILPLVVDLTNPSPSIGWQNQERASLTERGPVDTVLALAIVHHLAISNNVPFSKLATFFSSICNSLIIEFVPKTDSQVQRLLATREDVFPEYSQPAFETEFGKYFTVHSSVKILDSERTLYLMGKTSI